MTLVSVADHVVEPATVFAEHFPQGLAHRAPQLRSPADGGATWVLDGVPLGMPGGRLRLLPTPPGDGAPADATPGYAHLPAAAYDPDARLRAMDANGVLASSGLPTLAAFTDVALRHVADRALAASVVSAYNDWQVDGWAAGRAGRLVPLAVLPVWDVDASVAEVARVAARGVGTVAFPETPSSVDLPGFATEHWDPLLGAICDHGMAVHLQPPLGPELPHPLGAASGALFNPFTTQGDLVAPQLAAAACTDLLVSGVLGRFPDLRIVMSQGGIGWIPFLLDRIDLHLRNQVWSGLDLGGLTGTELFRRHFLCAFVTDSSSLFLRERIGVGSIAWQSAFPSADSTWPNSPELLLGELAAAQASDAEVAAIAWSNACQFLRLDAVAARARSGGTVGQVRGAPVDDGDAGRE